MLYVANQERLSSSVMQQLMAAVRESAELRAALGEAIRPEPVWWMNGDPWIDGAVRPILYNPVLATLVDTQLYFLRLDPHTRRKH